MRVVEVTYPTGAKCVMKPGEAVDVIGDEIGELTDDFYDGEESNYSLRVFDMPESEFNALPEFSGP